MKPEDIVTIFPESKNFHLKKDVGQVVFHLSKKIDCSPVLLTYKNEDKYEATNDEVKGLRLDFIRKTFKLFNIDFSILNYIIKNNKKIAVLNAYHPTIASKVYLSLYKILNRSGFAFLKLDLDLNHEKISNKIHIPWCKRIINQIVNFLFIRLVDRITIETHEGLSYLSLCGTYPVGKLIVLTNGVDHEYISQKVGGVSYAEKENLMITVGRIGALQKNHKLLLDALNKVNLDGWKICIIGGIESDFQKVIDVFLKENNNKENSIIFTGPIYNSVELYSYYKKAKIFLLCSDWEGFPLVYPEALYFGNFIITTNVSGSQDITQNNTIGKICPIGDVDSLADAIQSKIISGVQQDEFLTIRKHAEDFYTWDKSVAELGNIINNAKSYN